MIRLLHAVLDTVDRFTPALVDDQMVADLRVAEQHLSPMHSMAVNLERLGRPVPWRRPLAEALGRLRGQLERLRPSPAPGSLAESGSALVQQYRAFLAGAAPERLTKATLDGVAIVANMLDQQHQLLSGFLNTATALHAREDWVAQRDGAVPR